MKLECTSCGYAIPAADINIRLAIAKCPRCSEVFGFADQLDQDDDAGGILRVGLPRRFQVEQDGGELRVEYRWFRHELWFFVVWCSGWMGIVTYSLVQAAAEIAQRDWRTGRGARRWPSAAWGSSAWR